MDDLDVATEECLRHFNSGFSCAEAVFLVGCQGIGVDSDLVPKVATAFGGGLSRTKSICGALAGAAMVLSAKYGRSVPSDDRSALVSRVQELVADFRSRFGAEGCYDITGIDFSTPEGQADYRGRVHTEVCSNVVAFCLRRAMELSK